MKMILKLFLVCALCLLIVIILYLAGVFIYSALTEFKPPASENLEISNPITGILQPNTPVNIFTWNIGYAGLGAEMDFFYEGGKQVSPPEELNRRYLNNISSLITSLDTVGLLLLQEIDFDSKRSHRINQFEYLAEKLTGYSGTAAVNYQSTFVPVPFRSPMGKVKSGMAVFSQFESTKAVRVSTPGAHAWPKRWFTLKRCMLIVHIPVNNGKQLIIINVHNSAFSDEDELRKAELSLLREYLLYEYGLGNYVIAGGDWNQNPPGLDGFLFDHYLAKSVWPMDKNYLPEEWGWAFDPLVPTNRDVHEPFQPASTPCSILDYFVVSPNIGIQSVKTLDLQFRDSDHHPVLLQVILK